MIKKNKKESGQIIVLLAVSLVVVVVVAALAVDGGMIYSERRFAQNAADAASLAGGGSILNYMEKVSGDQKTVTAASLVCSDALVSDSTISDIIEKAQTDAILVAEANNISGLPYLGMILDGESYPNDLDPNFKHGVVISCLSHQYLEVQVRVTSSISTAFAHLVYPGDLVTTNEAVSRAIPYGVGDGGYAIVSLSPDEDNPMEFYGIKDKNGDDLPGGINVKNGKIHSNSSFRGTGSKLSVTATYGITSSLPSSASNLSPAGILTFTGDVPAPEIYIPDEPTCTIDGDSQMIGDVLTYYPGNYSGISISGNGDVVFMPGLYCVAGDLTITGSGGNKKATGVVSGLGVTFFIKPYSDGTLSEVDITGDKNVVFTAPKDDDPLPDPGDPGIPGYIFYMSSDNISNEGDPNEKRGSITIIGNSDSYYSGIILAPKGDIEIGGSTTVGDADVCMLVYGKDECEGSTFTTQLIGWTVRFNGAAQVDIMYDASNDGDRSGFFYLVK